MAKRTFRDSLLEFSKKDRMQFFWWLFDIRQASSSEGVKKFLTFFINRIAARHGGYIGRNTEIGDGISLPHGLRGIFISSSAKIGYRCRIYQNVTIGEVDGKAPQIGNDVLIGAGAILIGDIKIGNHAKIGAGALVTTDVPDYATAVSEPSRIIEAKEKIV